MIVYVIPKRFERAVLQDLRNWYTDYEFHSCLSSEDSLEITTDSEIGRLQIEAATEFAKTEEVTRYIERLRRGFPKRNEPPRQAHRRGN